MKINNKLKVAAVLAVLALNCPNSYAEDDIATFENLKTTVQGNSPATGNVSSDIQFLDSLDIGTDKNVTLKSTKEGGAHAAFTPETSSMTNKRAFTVNGTLDLTDVDLKNFDVQSASGDTNAKNGGAVLNKGNLSVKNSELSNNKAENGGAVYNDSSSNLNINDGASFKSNTASQNGGAVYNKGNLTITSSEKGVEFSGNSAAQGGDLYQEGSGKTSITGTGNVTFSSGIAGSGSITHSGSGDLKLNGDNSKYTGTFENSAGSVTVGSGSNFFGGTSTFSDGNLKWETSNDLGGTLKMTGGNLTVGSGSGPASKLTIKGDSNIDGAGSITINSDSTLALETDTQIKNSLSGSGNLTLSGHTLTFEEASGSILAGGSGLHFNSSNNSTVLIKNTSSIGNYINFVAGENAKNSDLTLQLQGVSGTNNSNLVIDGVDIKELDLLDTNTFTQSSDLTISGTGVMKNTGTTSITGNVNNSNTTTNGIDNSSDLTINGTLTNSGKIQNTKNLTVTTLNAQSGSDITNTNGKLNVTGTAENNGKISGGTLSFNSLNNNSEGVIQNAESVTVTNKLTNKGQISGADMTFGTLDNQNSLTSTSKLTITGTGLVADEKALKNSGTGVIQATDIDVKGDIENSGTSITATTGDITAVNITNTSGKIEATAGNITATGNLENSGTMTAAKGNITVTGNITNSGTKLSAGGTISGDSITNTSGSIEAAIITATKDIENSEASITASSGDISAVNITNTNGTIEATSGNITVSGNIQNTNGSIQAAAISAATGNIVNDGNSITAKTGDITAVDISNTNGTIVAENGNITATGDITNSGTKLSAAKTLSGNSITNTSGSIEAAVITATKDIVNNGASITASSGDISAVNITNTNATLTATLGNIIASGNITNNEGTIQAAAISAATGNIVNDGDSITAATGNIEAIDIKNNSGTMTATQGNITATGNLENAGTITAGQALSALKITNTAGSITAASIAATTNIENSGTSITATTGDISAVNITNTSGKIEATTGTITASGNLENSGTMTATKGNITVTGNITNSGTNLSAGGTLSGDSITNTSGSIQAAIITATNALQNSGTMIAADALSGATVTNNESGSITAASITATSGDIENSGTSITATTGDIEANSIKNNSGTLTATKGNITALGDITNTGSITAGGTLSGINITNTSGSVEAAIISATNNIENNGENMTASGDISAVNITNENGTIESTNGNVTADGNVTNTNASIKANKKLSATGSVTNTGSGTLTGGEAELGSIVSNDGTIQSTTGDITIADGITSNAGSISSAGILSVTGGVTNSGSVTANGKLTVTGPVTNSGAGSSLSGSTVEFGSVTSNEGTIKSTTGDITVNGALDNAGNITSAKDLTVKGALTNDEEGNIDIKGGSLAAVENNGQITNSGDLSISGAVTGSSGTITHNGGELTLSGDASDYTGTFNLDGGTLNVEADGTLFGGETNINNGSELDITSSGPIDFTGIVLKDNGKFKYTSTGENESTIDNNVLSFSGTNATATFAGKNETFTLADNFEGDGNNLTFSGTKLKLAGTDYQNAGAITLDDTTLNLHDDDYAAKKYFFKKFTSNKGKVDLDVQIQKAVDKDKTAYLETDQLHFDDESTGSLSIGKLHIANENNSENGVDITTAKGDDILQGGSVKFNQSTVAKDDVIYKATTSFTYDVYVSDKTITLQNTGYTDSDTLKNMNVRDGKREFSFEGKYQSNDNLGSTADGTFLVYGESKEGYDTLSGIKNETENEKVSFFNIEDGKSTHLEISDLIIEDTQSAQGGSVARNASKDSSVIVSGSIIQNNTSTDTKGGAFYNNGGRNIDFETEEKIDGVGLAIQESTLSGNKSDGLGGAIYNDKNGSLYLADVIVEAASGDALNDIYNEGNAFVESDDSLLVGGNSFQSKFTNKGNIIFEGQNTIADYVNDGNTKFNGYMFLDDVSGEASGEITNSLQVTLSGDASNYKGTYTQTQEAKQKNPSITQVEKDATFFGGITTIKDGILNWFTKKESKYTLNVEKGTVNIGDGKNETGTLNLTTGSSIAKGVETNIFKDSELGIMGDDVEVTLGKESTWEGNVNLETGTLNLDGITNATADAQGNIKDIVGTVSASGGYLNLQNGSVLAIDGNSTVAGDVILNIDKKSAAGLFGTGNLIVNDGDTWTGDLYMDKNATGTLTIDSYKKGSNGLLEANGGNLKITGDSDITLQSYGSGEELENSFIAKEVQTTIDKDATVHVKNGGVITLDEATGDNWAGTVDLRDGGTFNYGMTDITGTLTAEGGNLNLLEGSILKIKYPSVVEEAVAVDIQKGSIVKIENDAEFTIDSETNDKWNGTIQILKDGAETKGGSLITEGIDNTVSGYGGGLQQDTGSSTFDKKSNIHISDTSSYITGGEVNIKDESQLFFGAGVQDLSVDKLTMENNTKLGIMNGEINYAKAEEVDVDGTANFSIDLDPRNHKGDQFEFGSIIGRSADAKLNISDFNFQGGAPIDRYIYFELFTGDKTSVDFAATNDLKFTPIGWYGLQAMGEGMYRAYLDHYNPQVFRGQVSTIGMYTNQLMVDDIITNHFSLQAERMVDKAKLANKYSADNLLFAPYQHTYEDGGLWNKSYASFQKLDLTQNLNVGNNVYGTLLGADFPAIQLKNDWKFIPTGYVGYNGAHQHFNGVSSYQNGGQLGVMGTFLKNNFVGSVTAYGGGYINEMNVSGFNDETGNWFAGASAKTAYNLKLSKTFTFQPNLFAAYNGFGKQNWHTDFGVMGMQSGLLNGANIAPGANFIFDKDTWSLYATVQYMFFINDRINGRAGNVDLPNVRMNHGYIQYGFGGTKVFKDTFATFGQFNILNAGITGIGLQAGLLYKFDTKLPFTNNIQNSSGEKKYIKK